MAKNNQALEIARKKKCAACGKLPPNDPHHVTSKGAGGIDESNNLMPLCREHHTEWHWKGARSMILKYVEILSWLQKNERFDILEKVERVKTYYRR